MILDTDQILGETADHLNRGRVDAAAACLHRASELTEGVAAAWLEIGRRWMRRARFFEAGEAFESVLQHPRAPVEVWGQLGLARLRSRQAGAALEALERGLAGKPRSIAMQLARGHALRALGRTPEAAQAYRRVLASAPALGEAWWSLAALRSGELTGDDIDALRAQAQAPEADAALVYALARGLDQQGDYAEAFQTYSRGADMRARQDPHDPAYDRRAMDIMRSVFTEAYISAHGAPASGGPQPLFIVGLPRGGSTLVERILGAHPDVAMADETPYLIQSIGFDPAGAEAATRIAQMGRADWGELAARYMKRLVRHGEGRPVIIDKNPNNILLAGIIRTAFPTAPIMLARRDAMDQGVSAFTHLFAQGFAYTSRFEDFAERYRMADAMAAHMPGILTVQYEALVAEPERQIRTLVEGVGLDWHPDCLDFHTSTAPVHTASAEQVRAPIHQRSVGSWRRFAPWLDPLKTALSIPR